MTQGIDNHCLIIANPTHSNRNDSHQTAIIKPMSTICFEAKLFKIGSWTILRLPGEASAKLPSRGIAMVKGTINDSPLQTALEPDGRGSHWFQVDAGLRQAIGADAGDTVRLAIEPTRDWPEPEVPPDIAKALAADPPARDKWTSVTPMARWEWIRWIRATSQSETRKRHIKVARSKLKAGERRPCCFNSSLCTEPAVSSNGALLEPTPA